MWDTKQTKEKICSNEVTMPASEHGISFFNGWFHLRVPDPCRSLQGSQTTMFQFGPSLSWLELFRLFIAMQNLCVELLLLTSQQAHANV